MDKRLTWKLPEYLKRHDLTRYQLMQELGTGRGRIAYRWDDLPQRIDSEALEGVLGALERLTGKPVNVQDLLEYAPAPETEPDEEQALLESSPADLADMLDELEQDLPQEDREDWLQAFAEATR